MKTKKNKLLVPFNKKGDMLSDDYWGVETKVPPYEFKSQMIINDYGKGRSSVTFYLTDNKGRRYCMFLSEFIKLTKTKNIKDGVVEESTYTFCKRGTAYSIKLVDN
jgi:hypothetical protein